MAKYANPGNSGGGEDSYADASMPEHTEEPSKPEDAEEGKTYLLPIAIAEGKKFEPGDEIVLRIVAEHDDQFEVTYAPAKEQEGKEKGESSEGMGEEAPAGAPAGGQGGMGAMYE